MWFRKSPVLETPSAAFSGKAMSQYTSESQESAESLNQQIAAEFCPREADYEAIGKQLLRARIENTAVEIQTKMMGLAKLAEEGEFGQAELEEMARLHIELTETMEFVDNHLIMEQNPSDRND
jgi:phosphopantetheinyl transferase (holo-ACP synthase)